MSKQQVSLNTKSECIRVVIRCRPMSDKEIKDGRECAVKFYQDAGEVHVHKSDVPKIFTFDSVYDWNSEQENIFAETAYPVCEQVIAGYNGTIFAYGQTGTGKTFTITGVPKDPKLKGIMPRSFDNIFELIKCDSKKQYLVRVSYLEIYNEEIRDLLSKSGTQKLELKDKDTGVYVKDLSTFVVKKPEDMMEVFNEGNLNRHVGATNMNQDSSRSHSVFTITVESSERRDDGKDHITVGKLNIVDLAGSERQSKTGATGERLKEATKINLSLSTLCHVISSLTDSKCTYIPYRDSKLTRILQDSLGGNTKTVMCSNIGPADYNVEETLSTLRYASRAKQIQNKPRINEDPKDAMIREFHDEITRLRAELQAFSGGKINFDPNGGESALSGNNGTQTVTQVEHYVDPAKMKELEDNLEKEKKNIRKQFEKERSKIEAQEQIAEEEKMKLLTELKSKEEVAQKEKSKQQKLLRKIKNMEEKMLHGDEALEQAVKQEQQLLKQKAEIEDRKRVQRRIEQEVKAKKEAKLNLEQEFSSQQDQLENINSEIDNVWRKYQMEKEKHEDLLEMFHGQREDLMDRIRELTREIRKKHLIIDQFIPAQEYMKVERRAEWADEIDDWILPNIEYTGNNIKLQKAQSKNQNKGNEFMHEHIMNLGEESEDEDFEAAATKRVNDAINNILYEEEEEGLTGYVPPDKQSVFFRYTEEGAVREDPEEAAKKEKNRKRRQQSAKRPLTAKKKKSDMVTGDLVSMVQSMGAQQQVEKNSKKSKRQIFPKAKGLVSQ